MIGLLGAALLAGYTAEAQLLPEPPLIQHNAKKAKRGGGDLEWIWQYTPPPAAGREHEFLEDPHFEAFRHQYFTAPQSFWGPQNGDPKNPNHKSLADTVYDFLAIPGPVYADDNRYVTVTGCVFHFCPSRGMIFADLNGNNPLVVFAAIQWIKESHTTDQEDAEYTLWIFPSMVPKDSPARLSPALVHSLVRWMKTPLPGSGIVQKIRYAIVVAPDGTPQQTDVPMESIR
jgi:hypothetical protein